MKPKAWIWVAAILLGGVFITACTAPLLRPVTNPIVLEQRHGIDPALPHAHGVLLHYCIAGQCDLRLIDPATGEPFAAFPPFAMNNALFRVAPDGRTLAVIDYSESQYWSRGALKLVDLQAWRLVTTTVTVGNPLTPPLFSPDGKALAVAFPKYTWPPGERVQIIDVARRQLRAEVEPDFGVRQMRFSDNGEWLFLYGVDGSRDYAVNPQTHVALARAADLQIVWQHVLTAVRHGFFNPDSEAQPHADPENTVLWEPAVIFAPTGAQLYIVHADENRLTTVDFLAHTVHTTPISAKQSWFERLLSVTARMAKAKAFNGTTGQAAITPGGEYLYLTRTQHEYKNGQYTVTALGLQVIALTDSVEIAHLATTARRLTLSPEGTRLYLHCWKNGSPATSGQEWTEIVDATTLQPIATLAGRALTVGRRLDGRPILLSMIFQPDGQWEAATLDPTALTVLHTWRNQQTDEWGWFVTQ